MRAAGPSLIKIVSAIVSHLKTTVPNPAAHAAHELSLSPVVLGRPHQSPRFRRLRARLQPSRPALAFAFAGDKLSRFTPTPAPNPPHPAPSLSYAVALQIGKLAAGLDTIANASQTRQCGWHRLDIHERWMFLNIASPDSVAVPDASPSSQRLLDFFAKPSAAVAKLCFSDFLDDRHLTHSIYPGVVSALYLGQIICADNIGISGLFFSPFQFPKHLAANTSSTKTDIHLHLSATEGLGLSGDQAKKIGHQGCFAPTTSDEYRHQLCNFVAVVLFITVSNSFLFRHCSSWTAHFAANVAAYEQLFSRHPLLYAFLLWILNKRVHEYLTKARRAHTDDVFAPDALSNFTAILRRVLDGDTPPPRMDHQQNP